MNSIIRFDVSEKFDIKHSKTKWNFQCLSSLFPLFVQILFCIHYLLRYHCYHNSSALFAFVSTFSCCYFSLFSFFSASFPMFLFLYYFFFLPLTLLRLVLLCLPLLLLFLLRLLLRLPFLPFLIMGLIMNISPYFLVVDFVTNIFASKRINQLTHS